MQFLQSREKKIPRSRGNVATGVDRLGPELLSEIMLQGLPSYRLELELRWKWTLSYLGKLGRISSVWRRVRDSTATLWSFIYMSDNELKYGMFPRTTPLGLFHLFIARSNGALLELVLESHLSRDPGKLLRSLNLYTHFPRCRSLSLRGDWYIFEALFPLPSNMFPLRRLDISRLYLADDDIAVDIFKRDTKSKLRWLSLGDSPVHRRLPVLSSIPLNFITTLHFEGPFNPTILSFAARCPSLECLRLGDAGRALKRKDLSSIRTYVYPRLTSLEIEDQIPPLYFQFISAPRLHTLRIIESPTVYADEEESEEEGEEESEEEETRLLFDRGFFRPRRLQVLSLKGFESSSDPDSPSTFSTESYLEFFGGDRGPRLLEWVEFSGLVRFLMPLVGVSEYEYSAMKEDYDDDEDLSVALTQLQSHLPLPNLEVLRVCRPDSSPEEVYPLLSALLQLRPNLKVDFDGRGDTDPAALPVDRFRHTRSRVYGLSESYVPFEELQESWEDFQW